MFWNVKYVIGWITSYFEYLSSNNIRVFDHSEKIGKGYRNIIKKKQLIFCQCLQKEFLFSTGRGGVSEGCIHVGNFF